MAVIKGFKLPPVVVKGGLNQNKSSRFFSKGGLKVYFSDGTQRLNARRFGPRHRHYNDNQVRTMSLFKSAECAYKALPKSIREALKQYYESKGGFSATGLDFYHWFKKNFMTGGLDEFIRKVLGIKLVLILEEETYSRAHFKLKAEDATPGIEYVEWSDGKHHYKVRLAKRWIPYDYATVFIMKDKADLDHVKTLFLKQLPKSNETHFTIDKTELYDKYGKGDYYVMVSYCFIESNFVKLTVQYWPYNLWPLDGFYYLNMSQYIKRHITDTSVSLASAIEPEQPMLWLYPKFFASFFIEDRAGLPNCDYDYDDITMHVYRYKSDIIVKIYGTNGNDTNDILYQDSDGNEYFICRCPPWNTDLCAEVRLASYGRHIKEIKRYK